MIALQRGFALIVVDYESVTILLLLHFHVRRQIQ